MESMRPFQITLVKYKTSQNSEKKKVKPFSKTSVGQTREARIILWSSALPPAPSVEEDVLTAQERHGHMLGWLH